MLRAHAGRYMKVHLVFAMCKQKGMLRLNGSERRSHWTRDGSRDAERLAERRHAAWIACVQLSLVMCLVKRAPTSVDDTSAAGVSCVRRMATWRCEDKQRGGGCLVTTPHHV